MTAEQIETGRCPDCERDIALRRDGLLRKHGYWHHHPNFGSCPGSWERPEHSDGQVNVSAENQRVFKTYRHADNSPIMGEYSFMCETDYWDNEHDGDYLEVVEETWHLASSRIIKYGRTETWCQVCDEEFTLSEPAPDPHFCAEHSDGGDS